MEKNLNPQTRYTTAKQVVRPIVPQSTKVYVSKDQVKDTVLYRGVYDFLEKKFIASSGNTGGIAISADWIATYRHFRNMLINKTDCYTLCLSETLQDDAGVRFILKNGARTVRHYIRGEVYDNTLLSSTVSSMSSMFTDANPLDDINITLYQVILIDVYLDHLDIII